MLPPDDPEGREAFWRDFLTNGDRRERRLRNVFRHLPSDPRCQLCAAPFKGPAAGVMRALGKRPSEKNPTVCNACYVFLAKHHGGAEIECTLLFADIRGSTTIAEGMSSGSFRTLLDRFYSVASNVVFAHEGEVDKFVGDELVALFFPFIAGARHADRAVAAARALLEATGHASADGPWVPVGAGVHTGPTWIGAVGDAAHTEITALGDTVNTTSRLASAAEAGQILVTVQAAVAAGLDPTLPRRRIELKGKAEPTEVVSLTVPGTDRASMGA
ncbi:MAG TPA: adenylate/guanylate cyclase domain-containing protein [Candidatus Limnocylindria bacterium]|nr:adenylate/guanylate cyclase domain-containing protein [Candidatus Limnocylindria bacterium]